MKRLYTFLMWALLAMVCVSCAGEPCQECLTEDEDDLVKVSVILGEPLLVSGSSSVVYVYNGDVLMNRYSSDTNYLEFYLPFGTYGIYVFSGVEELPLNPSSVGELLQGVPVARYRVFGNHKIERIYTWEIYVN